MLKNFNISSTRSFYFSFEHDIFKTIIFHYIADKKYLIKVIEEANVLPTRVETPLGRKPCLRTSFHTAVFFRDHSGAPNENIVQTHLNVALLNVF